MVLDKLSLIFSSSSECCTDQAWSVGVGACSVEFREVAAFVQVVSEFDVSTQHQLLRKGLLTELFFQTQFVLDLSGPSTWANADLCTVIQDLVEALSLLWVVPKGHEERLGNIESAMLKTSQVVKELSPKCLLFSCSSSFS